VVEKIWNFFAATHATKLSPIYKEAPQYEVRDIIRP